MMHRDYTGRQQCRRHTSEKENFWVTRFWAITNLAVGLLRVAQPKVSMFFPDPINSCPICVVCDDHFGQQCVIVCWCATFLFIYCFYQSSYFCYNLLLPVVVGKAAVSVSHRLAVLLWWSCHFLSSIFKSQVLDFLSHDWEDETKI